MAKRTLFDSEGPVTQSFEAVRTMCSALGKPVDKLPKAVKLSRDVVLVLSANKDCYYTATREHGCSCPSSIYHPDRPCKHQRKYLGIPPVKQLRHTPLQAAGYRFLKSHETARLSRFF